MDQEVRARTIPDWAPRRAGAARGVEGGSARAGCREPGQVVGRVCGDVRRASQDGARGRAESTRSGAARATTCRTGPGGKSGLVDELHRDVACEERPSIEAYAASTWESRAVEVVKTRVEDDATVGCGGVARRHHERPPRGGAGRDRVTCDCSREGEPGLGAEVIWGVVDEPIPAFRRRGRLAGPRGVT